MNLGWIVLGLTGYGLWSHHLTSSIKASIRLNHGVSLSRGHQLSLYVLSPLTYCLIIIGDVLLGEKG